MISIIGAGPVGCFLGSLLAEQGKDVSIYEEHAVIGKPMQCTGIVTKELAGILPVKKDLIINRLNTVRVHSYNNHTDIKVNEFVLDRIKFDQYLADLAVKNGAKLFLSHKVVGIKKDILTVKNKGNIKKVKSEVIIGADGPDSIVSKRIDNVKPEYYLGLQARVRGNFNPAAYEAYFGSICPDFFAWIVPESKTIARIGLASKNNTNVYFDKFLKKLKIKNIINKQAGLIPMYNKKIRVQKENMYLVGDAAAQVKATTGGGLVFGLKAAKILAGCIINKEDYGKNLKKINRELYLHLLMRRILNRFKDKDYSSLIRLVDNKKIQNTLKNSNREYPLKLMFKLLLNEPKFLLFAKKILF
jgi:geranylgeranyl reductase family protein